VLGIQLPLDESGQARLNEEIKEQILQEHFLYEGFLSNLIDTAKSAAGKIKDLLTTLAQILQDGNALKKFTGYIGQKVIRPIVNKFKQAFAKIKEMGGEVGAWIEGVATKFLSTIDDMMGMSDGWKKAMAFSSVALLLKYAYEKIGGLLGDVIGGKVEDEFVDWIKEKFTNMFGQGLMDKVAAKITDIKTWLGWIGPVVGGLGFVADTLTPVTSRMQGNL
jgi:hypothetical protein